jgi:tetratricopeptide (TPR) repeat protein
MAVSCIRQVKLDHCFIVCSCHIMFEPSVNFIFSFIFMIKVIQKNYAWAIILAVGIICASCNHRGESEEFCRKGYSELTSKQFKASLEDYNKAIAADSSYGMGWEGRGASEYYLDDYKNAIKDEFRAFTLDSNLKNVRNWIGNVKRELGDYKGSIEYYNRSIARGGENDLARAYEGRGATEYYLNDYTKAMEDINKSISLDNTLEYANYWKGMIERSTGDYKASKEDFTQAIHKGAYTGKAFEWRASAEYHLNEYENALSDINRAILLDTTLNNANGIRAVIEQAMENYKSSVEDYTIAIKRADAENKTKDYEGLAIDEYYLKDYANALAYINLAVSDTTLRNAVAWKTAIEKAAK